MQVKLRVQTGNHEGREIAIATEKFLVGRSEICQLRPKSESISRKHCIIVLKDSRVLIQDLKSRNGTYINDKRLPTDKAKVLRNGDQLRIGKLKFEVVIEHGLQAAKKPEVHDVGEAAARMVENNSSDSRFEEVDVDAWLDEADQINRVRTTTDPETRQFQVESKSEEQSTEDTSEAKLEVSEDETVANQPKRTDRKRSKPGKLPEEFKKSLTANSQDAANHALKNLFSR